MKKINILLMMLLILVGCSKPEAKSEVKVLKILTEVVEIIKITPNSFQVLSQSDEVLPIIETIPTLERILKQNPKKLLIRRTFYMMTGEIEKERETTDMLLVLKNIITKAGYTCLDNMIIVKSGMAGFDCEK